MVHTLSIVESIWPKLQNLWSSGMLSQEILNILGPLRLLQVASGALKGLYLMLIVIII